MSSAWHTTPSRPCRMDDIRLWKCSGAELIPNGSLRNLKRPHGLMNVVRCDDSADRGICQYPALQSILLITLAPDNCASECSTTGIGCSSRKTALLSCV